MCFLCYIKHVPHGAADSRITALGDFWITNGCDWDRKRYPTLKNMMKGYRNVKPSQIRRKNRFTLIHMQKAFDWINLNSSYCLLSGTA